MKVAPVPPPGGKAKLVSAAIACRLPDALSFKLA
jgi:hypothetical protein